MARKINKSIPTTSSPKDWICHVDLKELREHAETLELFCQEIRDFAYSDKAKDIDAFCRAYRIRPTKLYEWRQEIPAIDDAMKELTEQVHIYRRMLWGERLMAENNFLRYAHLHCKSEKEVDKYHDDRKRELKQDETPSKIVITVNRSGEPTIKSDDETDNG